MRILMNKTFKRWRRNATRHEAIVALVVVLPLLIWSEREYQTRLQNPKELPAVRLALSRGITTLSAGELLAAHPELGFYKKRGLDVSLHQTPSSIETTTLILRGWFEFGVIDAALLAHARCNGAALRAIYADHHKSPLLLAHMQGAASTELVDILSGPIAVNPQGADSFILNAMAAKIGRKATTTINCLIEDPVSSLRKGHFVAVASTVDRLPVEAAKDGLRISQIKPHSYGLDTYGDVIFTSEDYLNENALVAKDLLEATDEGWSFLQNSPRRSAALLHTEYAELSIYPPEELYRRLSKVLQLREPKPRAEIGLAAKKARWSNTLALLRHAREIGDECGVDVLMVP